MGLLCLGGHGCPRVSLSGLIALEAACIHHHPANPWCPHRRIYADLAEVFGSDPTWGLHAVMMSALNCTAIDLADPEELLYDPSPAAR